MLIPKGTYRGVLAGTGAILFATSSEKSTENVQIRVRFTRGPEAVVGQERTWFGYMTDGSWERTVEVLRFLLPTWTTGRLKDALAISRGAAIDEREVELVIEHEAAKEKDGRPKLDPKTGEQIVNEKLAWINVPRVFGEPMDDAAIDAFSARWESSVVTVRSAAGAQAARGQAVSPTQPRRASAPSAGFGGDDGIPPPGDGDAPPERGRGGHPFSGGR